MKKIVLITTALIISVVFGGISIMNLYGQSDFGKSAKLTKIEIIDIDPIFYRCLFITNEQGFEWLEGQSYTIFDGNRDIDLLVGDLIESSVQGKTLSNGTASKTINTFFDSTGELIINVEVKKKISGVYKYIHARFTYETTASEIITPYTTSITDSPTPTTEPPTDTPTTTPPPTDTPTTPPE